MRLDVGRLMIDVRNLVDTQWDYHLEVADAGVTPAYQAYLISHPFPQFIDLWGEQCQYSSRHQHSNSSSRVCHRVCRLGREYDRSLFPHERWVLTQMQGEWWRTRLAIEAED